MPEQLARITAWMDEVLNLEEIPDYPAAHNGLQLTNGGLVTKVGAAVDASYAVIQKAISSEIDLLLVHHGLFWGGVQPIRGAYYEKLKLAMAHNLAIYSAHIPLDVHEQLGNNALLCRALGLDQTEPFLPWKGILLGRKARVEWSRAELRRRVAAAVGGGDLRCCLAGPEMVRDLGVITGGAGSEVAAVAAEGIDTFITGEGPHHTFPLAEELRINLVYAGHYATETFGVRSLAESVAREHRLEHCFVDHPTGL